MKFLNIIVLATAIIATPAVASDKSKLEAKGLVKLNNAQIAKIKIGKTIRGTYVPGQKKWKATYKKGGIKLVRSGGKKTEMQWSFNSGRWCETVQKKMNCNYTTYKLKNQCYIFKGNKIEHKFGC